MRTRFLLPLLALLPFFAAAQSDTVSVRITHGSACEARVTLEQLKALPLHSATIQNHEGKADTYEGARLQEVLELACPSIAAMEKRTRIRCAVRASASDGYSALVAYMEVDTTFRDPPPMTL